MKALSQIWAEMPLKSDKGDVHDYLGFYEHILEPYRETAKSVLEIGLFQGASLLMWEQYFVNADVYGMDCDIKPHGGMADLTHLIEEKTHNIIIGDAENAAFIHGCFNGIKFDVVVEDAGHDVNQQVKIYNTLKPYLNKGSIYCIEDIQDIDSTREVFENIDKDKEVLIIDRRHIKNRYDDVLVIIKDKA